MAFWKPGAERPASALDRDASAPVWLPSAAPLPVQAARSRILYALEQYAVVVLVGETSGEKIVPTAYSDRFSPYCLARRRFTSRISTSNMISARALSFCWITFSMICW